MILFVADEITVDQVVRSLREGDNRRELLFQVVGNGVKTYHALLQNYAARVHTDYAVHVPGDVELL